MLGPFLFPIYTTSLGPTFHVPLVMPRCTVQHKKNKALPDLVCHPTLGTGYLPPRPLQCPPSRSPSSQSETPTDGPECSGASHHSTAHWPPLIFSIVIRATKCYQSRGVPQYSLRISWRLISSKSTSKSLVDPQTCLTCKCEHTQGLRKRTTPWCQNIIVSVKKATSIWETAADNGPSITSRQYQRRLRLHPERKGKIGETDRSWSTERQAREGKLKKRGRWTNRRRKREWGDNLEKERKRQTEREAEQRKREVKESNEWLTPSDLTTCLCAIWHDSLELWSQKDLVPIRCWTKATGPQ